MTADLVADDLLDVLRCVRCRGASRLKLGGPGAAASPGALRCEECGARYPLRDGIPDFAGAEACGADRPLGQRWMESRIVARIYETVLWRRSHTWLSGVSLRREMDEVLRWASPLPAAPILDLGSGPGLYARRFARESPAALVVALDLSLPMLHRATLLARRRRIDNLVALRADLRRLPFAEGSFARVHAGGVLHLLPDLGPVWREVARVLHDGGVFTAMTVRQGGGIAGWVQRRAVKRGKGSFLDRREVGGALEAAGLTHLETREHGLMLLLQSVRRARGSSGVNGEGRSSCGSPSEPLGDRRTARTPDPPSRA